MTDSSPFNSGDDATIRQILSLSSQETHDQRQDDDCLVGMGVDVDCHCMTNSVK